MTLNLAPGQYPPRPKTPENLKRQQQVRLEIRLSADEELKRVDARRRYDENQVYNLRQTRKPYIPKHYIPRKH